MTIGLNSGERVNMTRGLRFFFSANILFVQKMSARYYICCIYSNALLTNFIMEANNMEP